MNRNQAICQFWTPRLVSQETTNRTLYCTECSKKNVGYMYIQRKSSHQNKGKCLYKHVSENASLPRYRMFVFCFFFFGTACKNLESGLNICFQFNNNFLELSSDVDSFKSWTNFHFLLLTFFAIFFLLIISTTKTQVYLILLQLLKIIWNTKDDINHMIQTLLLHT